VESIEALAHVRGSHRHIDPGRWSKPKHYLEISSRVRIKRAKVSASKSRLTSIRRPFASTTSRAQISGSLRSTLVRVTLTSTNGLPSPCPPTSLRRLLSPRCKVLNAKPCLWQKSLCRSPLDSNSTTSRLISRRLRRFPALTTSLSVMPTVHQKPARSTRWVRLTEPPVPRRLRQLRCQENLHGTASTSRRNDPDRNQHQH